MNTKHYLVISGIVGGVIGSLLTTILVSPVTAQRDKFGEIECTALSVVDEEGNVKVFISGGESGRDNYKDNLAVFIGADELGGIVDVKNTNPNPYDVRSGSEIECSKLRIVDKEGNVKVIISGNELELDERYDARVFIGADPSGGIVDVNPDYSNPHHLGKGGRIECNTIKVYGGQPSYPRVRVAISGYSLDQINRLGVSNRTTFIGVREGSGDGVIRVGGTGRGGSGTIHCGNLMTLDYDGNTKLVLGSNEWGDLFLKDTGVVYIGPHTHGNGTVITRDNYGDETNRIR